MPHVAWVNPSWDREFSGLVDRMAPQSERTEELQQYLRRRYPKAVVRARLLSGEVVQVWYVYRDGWWTDARKPSSVVARSLDGEPCLVELPRGGPSIPEDDPR
jgi:hypothetical protein